MTAQRKRIDQAFRLDRILVLAACFSAALGIAPAVADGLPVIEIPARAYPPALTSPAAATALQVIARKPDQGANPLIYRWVKVGGPTAGEVEFFPNGDEYSNATIASFNPDVPGTYTLRVIVTDGHTETISEVQVSIDSGSSARASPMHAERSGDGAAGNMLVRFKKNGNRPGHGLSESSRVTLEMLGARIAKVWLDGRLGLVEFPADVDEQSALDMIGALPEFEYAVADQEVKLDVYEPNDPHFPSQWALKNDGGVDLNATLAWDQSTSSAEVLVAVMDTGVDYTHPDLYLALALNNAEIPASLLPQLTDTDLNGVFDFYDLNSLDANAEVVLDSSGSAYNQGLVTDQNGNGYVDAGDLQGTAWTDGIDNDGNGYIDDLTGWNHVAGSSNVMDTHGHGTHVAGIIGARGDNAKGIAGVNWRSRILPERFHSGGGGSVSGAIQAIDHAVAMGARVINASWGTVDGNVALKDAIVWAGENGAVVVVAAGNGSSDIDSGASVYYPASHTGLSNLVAVASVDPSGALSSFSNFGSSSVDLAAPGASILSTGIGGSYVLWSGTSMATAHVSGVVSLVAGLFPDATLQWLMDRVLTTVTPLPGLAGKVVTGGSADAYAAVNTSNLAGPRVVMADPIGDVAGPVDRVVLTFDSLIDAQTFATADANLIGPSGSIGLNAVNSLDDIQFEVLFPSQVTVGTYTLRVGPQVEDSAGRAMDQDRDGITGEPIDDRFTVVFRVLPAAPETWIVDNGGAGYGVVGSWSTYSGVGAEGDFAYKQVGTGSATATWTASGLTPGQYRVSATWAPYSNRAVDAPYTVSDGTTDLVTVAVNQRLSPADFVEDGVSWQDLGVVQLAGTTLAVQLSDQAGPSGSYVIADAVRLERVGEVVAGPELEVLEGGTDIVDGVGSVDFGATVVGAPVSRTITVRNAGTQDLALGPLGLPSGFGLVADFGSTLLQPGAQTTFEVELEAYFEGSYAGTISFDSNDADESPFEFNVTGTVSAAPQLEPELEVLEGGTDIVDGVGSVDFGSTVVGAPVSRTITVRNVGTQDLALGPLGLPSGFGLVADFGSTLLQPGAQTTFEVELEAYFEGSYAGTISFDSNDADESPFDFNVTGTVSASLPPPAVTTIDNGGAGYGVVGSWSTYSGVGAEGDFAYKQVGTGSATATWTASGLTPGQYRVSATWEPYSNRAVDASYTVLDGTTQLTTIAVDQRLSPTDLLENGVSWQDLGVVQLTGTTLVVQLSDQAGPSGSYVIADAVRVEYISP